MTAFTPTSKLRVCSLKPSSGGVLVLAFVDPHGRSGLEARVVDGGHELLGEEGAHRLAQRVRRRNLVRPSLLATSVATGTCRCRSRRPRAGRWGDRARAALEAAQETDGLFASCWASTPAARRRAARRRSPVLAQRTSSPSIRRASSYARSGGSCAHERLRHQPFEYGVDVSGDERFGGTTVGFHAALAGRPDCVGQRAPLVDGPARPERRRTALSANATWIPGSQRSRRRRRSRRFDLPQ